MLCEPESLESLSEYSSIQYLATSWHRRNLVTCIVRYSVSQVKVSSLAKCMWELIRLNIWGVGIRMMAKNWKVDDCFAVHAGLCHFHSATSCLFLPEFHAANLWSFGVSWRLRHAQNAELYYPQKTRYCIITNGWRLRSVSLFVM